MSLDLVSLSRKAEMSGNEHRLLRANPADLKVKIEHDADFPSQPAPVAAACSTEEKLRAYRTMKDSPRPTVRSGCWLSWQK